MFGDISKLLLPCMVLLGLSQTVVYGYRLVGDPCSDEHPCAVLYSTCNNDSICECEKYHARLLPTTCDEKLKLGAPCNTSEICSGDSVECSGNNETRCQCIPGFYDDTNDDVGGTCYNISEIMIRNFRVEETNQSAVVFGWKLPVSRYNIFQAIEYVEFELQTRISFHKFNIKLLGDSITIVNLNPGATMKARISYVDTDSRDSIQYYRSPIVYGTANPAKPGELVNASQYAAPNVQIEWLPSNKGYVDLYRVQLTDNDKYNRSKETDNATFSAEFTDLKPNTTYTVTIVAISGIQYNASSESQPRVQLITTAEPYIQLGSSCNFTEQCIGENVECSSSKKCQCKSGFYDDNSIELGGSCNAISKLMVQNLRVEAVDETSVQIRWNNRPINVFASIEWVEMELDHNGTEYKFNLSLESESHNVSDMYPGESLFAAIIFVDTNSRDSTQYFRSPTVAGTTKPAQPGGLINTTRYIAPTIQIKWLPSNIGKVELYRVQLTNNAQYNHSKEVANTTAEFTDLQPSTTYTVTITAISGVEYNAPSESQPRVQLITTEQPPPSAPQSLMITNITDSSFVLAFDKPAQVNGILAGYVIRIHKGDNCVQKITLKCQACSVQWSLDDECSDITSGMKTVLVPDVTIASFAIMISDLHYYTHYTVNISAIDDLGIGSTATISMATSEVAPDTPYNVQADQISQTWIALKWDINGTEPGQTEYIISVFEIQPNGSETVRFITVPGFYQRTVNITGLEEYWPYRFQVEAKTSVDSSFSIITGTVYTAVSAPGLVVDLDVTRPDDSYRYAYVSWQNPPPRERNGVLRDYTLTYELAGVKYKYLLKFKDNATIMKMNVTVHPDHEYEFHVYLTNTENMTGQISTMTYYANSGVPQTLLDLAEIIPKSAEELNSTQTSFDIEINARFFNNSENGELHAFGLAVCKTSNCNPGEKALGSTATYQDWEYIRTWDEAKRMGFPLYRITNIIYMSQLRELLKDNEANNATIIPSPYVVGDDTVCSSVIASSVYCNGPVDAGSQYSVVVFACTKGGCINSGLSAPFSTLPGPPSTDGLSEGEKLAIGICAALVTVFIVVSIIVYLRRRNANSAKRHFPDQHQSETNF